LKTNLLKTIIDKNKQNKPVETKDAQGNVINQKNKVVTTANKGKQVSDNPNCTPFSRYSSYYRITPQSNKVSYREVYNTINTQIVAMSKTVDYKLKYVVFSALYLESGTKTGFEAFENNFTGIELTGNWGTSEIGFKGNEQFFCLTSGDFTQPYAVFNDLTSNVRMLLDRWDLRMHNLKDNSATEIAKFLILNTGPNIKTLDVYTSMTEIDRKSIEDKVQEAIKIWDANS
jgi:hypothetical protein